MARPTITYRASIYSTTGAASYTVDTAFTPAANAGLIALVVTTYASAPSDPTGVTGHGATFTKLTSLALSTTHLLSIWYADAGATPSSVATVAACTGSPTGAAVIEFEVTGHSTLVGIGRSISSFVTGTGSGTSGSITYPLTAHVVDETGWISFYCHLAAEATAGQGGNWTQSANASGNFATPNTGASGQFNTTGYTSTATASWTTSSSWAGIVIEIESSTTTQPFELLHIQDSGLTARRYGDATPQGENVKIAEQLTARMGLAVSLTETLKLSETPVPALDPLRPPILTETSKLSDLAQGAAEIVGFVRITDGPAQVTIDPEQATPTETLRLADTVSAVMDLGVTLQETLKLSDGPALRALDPEQAAPATENLKLADTVLVTLDPEQAAPPVETVKISDTVTAAMQLAVAVASENVKISDGPAQLTLNPLATSLSETLHVVDSVSAALTAPDITVLVTQEALKLADGPVSAQLTPLLPAQVLSESLRLADTVSATLDPLQASPAETLKLADGTPAGRLDPLQVAVPDENVRLADTVSAQGDLAAAVSETLRISDNATAVEPHGVTGVTSVTGTYVTRTAVVGTTAIIW